MHSGIWSDTLILPHHLFGRDAARWLPVLGIRLGCVHPGFMCLWSRLLSVGVCWFVLHPLSGVSCVLLVWSGVVCPCGSRVVGSGVSSAVLALLWFCFWWHLSPENARCACVLLVRAGG